MTMEQTLLVAARLRLLTDYEFKALRLMIEQGEDPSDEETLAAICEALADCAGVVRAKDQRTVFVASHREEVAQVIRTPSTSGRVSHV